MAVRKTSPHSQRIRRAQQALQDSNGALVLSAPASIRRSRGVEYPFRQESDLYYLTGFTGSEVTLLISCRSKAPVMLVPRTDPLRVVWEGKGPDIRPIARAIGAELIVTGDIEGEIMKRLRGLDTLFYQSRSGTVGNRIATRIFNLDPYVRGPLPAQFVAADRLLAPLRLIKSADEVQLMRNAADITNNALYSVVPLIRHGVSEAEIQQTLEYVFRASGGEVAFHTITAAGKNAAVLHYHGHKSRLKRGEMLLIDCGAEYNMYAADISRTLPVNGEFESTQRMVYETVLAAQMAAIRAIKPGVPLSTPYNAAALVLIEGLKELGVLKGNTRSLLKNGAHSPYFPHGIGHSLGIEVHDTGELRGNNAAVLAEGMVITIEPGLYFPRPVRGVPACGVRIEDDILVTRKGAVVLSEGFPKDPDELCELIASL